MKCLFLLKGRDVDGTWVLGLEVKEEDMPLVPRVEERVRIFDQIVVVNVVEYGRRHDQEWGATIYVEPWDDEAERRAYDSDVYNREDGS